MRSFLTNEEIHTGRLYQLDLLKAESIICMVFCHTTIRLASHRPDYLSEFWYFFADSLLGCVIAGAYTFMFAMGVGFSYSKRSSSGELIKRGLQIYVLVYVLNFFRDGIYSILDYVLRRGYAMDLWHSMSYQDIFQFAGLAMIFTAFLRKIRLDERGILIVGILLSCLEIIIPDGFSSKN